MQKEAVMGCPITTMLTSNLQLKMTSTSLTITIMVSSATIMQQ